MESIIRPSISPHFGYMYCTERSRSGVHYAFHTFHRTFQVLIPPQVRVRGINTQVQGKDVPPHVRSKYVPGTLSHIPGVPPHVCSRNSAARAFKVFDRTFEVFHRMLKEIPTYVRDKTKPATGGKRRGGRQGTARINFTNKSRASCCCGFRKSSIIFSGYRAP